MGKPSLRDRYRTSRKIFRQGLQAMATERDLWRFPLLATLTTFPLVLVIMAVGGWLSTELGLEFGPWTGLVGFLLASPLFIPLGALSSSLMGAFAYALFKRMSGEPCSREEAWAEAKQHWRTFARFQVLALLVAGLLQVVGVVLDKLRLVPYIGQLTQVLGSFGWAVATYFVIPVVVIERETSAVQAVKDSVGIAREHWGKSVSGIVTLGLVLTVPIIGGMLVLMAITMPLSFVLMSSGAPFWLAMTLMMAPMALMFLALMIGMVWMQAAHVAYQVALYRFARWDEISAPFDRSTLVEPWESYRT